MLKVACSKRTTKTKSPPRCRYSSRITLKIVIYEKTRGFFEVSGNRIVRIRSARISFAITFEFARGNRTTSTRGGEHFGILGCKKEKIKGESGAPVKSEDSRNANRTDCIIFHNGKVSSRAGEIFASSQVCINILESFIYLIGFWQKYLQRQRNKNNSLNLIVRIAFEK